MARSPLLTRAELEVVECVAHGWDYAHIADWLGIAELTAKGHVLNIARKLPPQGDLRGYSRVLYYARRMREAA